MIMMMIAVVMEVKVNVTASVSMCMSDFKNQRKRATYENDQFERILFYFL
jgi:hypothetical protein